MALVLSGCAPRVFVHPNPAVNQPADAAQCEFEIEMAQRGINVPWYYSNRQATGYLLGASIGIALRNDRLRALCMQAKGYIPAGAAAPYPVVMEQPSYGQLPQRQNEYEPKALNTQPVGASPRVARLAGQSTYQIKVENMVKSGGCAPPDVGMTAKGAGTETFTVGCPNGVTMTVKCDAEVCRVLQ